MNEKIQKLIEELAEECQKKNIGLALATTDTTGEIGLVRAGEDYLVAIATHAQYIHVKEMLEQSDCTCEMHETLKEIYEIKEEETSKPTHTFFLDDINDIPTVLNRILRGDFE